jgi:hypothetical protein
MWIGLVAVNCSVDGWGVVTSVDEVRGTECVWVSSFSGGGRLAANLVFTVVVLPTQSLTALVSVAKLSYSLALLHSTALRLVEWLFVLSSRVVSLEDEEVTLCSAILHRWHTHNWCDFSCLPADLVSYTDVAHDARHPSILSLLATGNS